MGKLSPLLAAMKAEPERLWLTEELENLGFTHVGHYLAQFFRQGLVDKFHAPRPSRPRGVVWKYLRDPHHARPAQNLKPADPKSKQGQIMRVFEANPDAWITNRDLIAVYPERKRTQYDFSDLVLRGYLERQTNADGYLEYHLLRLPTTGGQQGYNRRPVRPGETKRIPCPAARSKPKKEKCPAVQSARAFPDEAQEIQQVAARQAHFTKTQAMRTSAQQQIVAYLEGRQEPETANQIKDALGLTLGVQKVAIVALMHAGVVVEIPGPTVTYRLLKPEFPEVPAQMNRAAERLYGLLFGRADTELGLMSLTGWQRAEVRAALARLNACGRLSWSGVGHLLIYRVTEVAQERAA